MTRSVIGSNVALRYLKAYRAHVDYWYELNPYVMLGYVDKPDHAKYIQEYAAEFPNALVVARIRHELDGGFHLAPTGKDDHREYVASPIDYHNAYGFLGRIENVILNVMNEPNGFADDATIKRLVRWMTEYIAIAAKSKTKSLLFNWADRNPRIIDSLLDGRFDEVLTMAAHYPDLFYIGFHFYGPDPVADVIKAYVARCEKLSIKPLKVIGSEFGIDSTGGNERGYKSRKDYADGDKYARWQISVVNGELAPYFKSGVLVGLTVFQEGNSGGWPDFDIENDSAYKSELKRAVLAGELDMLVRNIQSGTDYRISLPGGITRVYRTPSLSDPLTSKTLPDMAVIKAGNKVTIGSETWLQFEYKPSIPLGWMPLKNGVVKLQTLEMPIVVDDSPTKPLPVKPDEPPQSATTSDKPDISTNGNAAPDPLKTRNSDNQREMLEQWRGELQFKANHHKAELDMCTARLNLIDQMLSIVKV